MMLASARRLLQVRADCGGFYKADAGWFFLPEVMKEYRRQALDGLISELKPGQIFAFRPGSRFKGGLALDPVNNRH